MALSDVDAYHGLMRAAQEGRPFVDGRGVPASAVREVAVGPQVAGDFLQIAGWLLASAAATAALNLVGRDGDAQQPTEPRWTPS